MQYAGIYGESLVNNDRTLLKSLGLQSQPGKAPLDPKLATM